MKRLRFFWFVLMAGIVILLTAIQPAVGQSLSNGKGDLRVMTYNVDEGTDYTEVRNAGNLQQFLIAVGQTITQVRATDPPSRMQAVAGQIIAARPALVSLQELDQWSTGSFNPATGKCGPVGVEFDMLPELMDALASQGAHYQVAVQSPNWTIPPTPGLILPDNKWVCVQVVDYIAILARNDILSTLQLENPQAKQFDHILIFHSPAGDVPFARAWISVDATYDKKAFRLIGTHLESVDPNIRRLQGEEIRLGPANTSLPVIVAMDSNAQAFPLPQDPTYVDFMVGGFKDVWSETMPNDPGLTCCQAQFVDNVDSQLYQRIDLILTSNNVEAQRAALFGVNQLSKTPAGLWPSDHAGVAAQLNVLKLE